MRQFRAIQNTPQYGPQSLHMRFIDKLIFMKGAKGSDSYVDKLIEDFEKKGASILRGNGGWLRIDIIKNNDLVKLGEVEIIPEDMTMDEIEGHLFDFFAKKYTEANFVVQELK